MSDELDWRERCDKIPRAGTIVTRDATADERIALAAALELVACEKLSATIKIHPFGRDAFSVSGSLFARIVQTCVVTLDPVANSVKATFAAEFRDPADIRKDTGEVDLDSADPPEAIVAGELDLGGIVYEALAGAIDLYPRKDGVAFDWVDPKATPESAARPNPFATLARLKPKT